MIGIGDEGIFCRPSCTVLLEMLMKSDKLQNYIPREMFFFSASDASESLDFGE